MRKTMLRIATLLSFLLLISFAVIVVNQTAQLVELADRVSPAVGSAVFWGLIALYGFCLIVPIFLLLRLPKPLKPPPSEDHPEFPTHLERLGKRLSRNPLLSDPTIVSRPEIETALITLDSAADQRSKAAASQVFITTAISQNGSLDALLVLAAQSKLILEIARVYYQRPTLRDLIFLYTNVGATAFIAGELEDLDLSEQVQPVLTSVLGSAAGAIPGLGAATNLFVNSVVTGTGNAFLTLRVGAITKQYCRATVLLERRIIRRVAVVEAASMLGAIAKDGAKRVANAFASGSKNAFVSAYTEMRDDLRFTGSELKRKSREVTSKLRPQREPGDGLEGT
jgi:hypothetical protein